MRRHTPNPGLRWSLCVPPRRGRYQTDASRKPPPDVARLGLRLDGFAVKQNLSASHVTTYTTPKIFLISPVDIATILLIIKEIIDRIIKIVTDLINYKILAKPGELPMLRNCLSALLNSQLSNFSGIKDSPKIKQQKTVSRICTLRFEPCEDRTMLSVSPLGYDTTAHWGSGVVYTINWLNSNGENNGNN